MILVTGGTGFVGGAIVRELTARGKDVAVLTRNPERARESLNSGVEARQGDVTDPSTLPSAMQGIETVIGAQQFPNYPMENPSEGYTFEEIDRRGTERLVAAAKEVGVQRYIYMSGAGAAPDAKYHWFRSKWHAEEAVRNSGLRYIIFRPSWIFGPRDVSLNRFLGMSRFLPFVPLIGSPGKQRVQPAFVDDVANAVATALDNPDADGKTLEIGGPEVVTMSELVKIALDVTGRKRLLLPAPAFVMKAVASVAQFAPRRPLTPDGIDFITQDALGDPTEVEKTLGIKMTPLRDALASYLGK